jgi:hypothetical protein
MVQWKPHWYMRTNGRTDMMKLQSSSLLMWMCRKTVSPRLIAQQPLIGQGLLVIEASRSHSDTTHWVGLLLASDQPDAETYTWQLSALTRYSHASVEIRTRNPSKRAALDLATTGIGKNAVLYPHIAGFSSSILPCRALINLRNWDCVFTFTMEVNF